MSILLILLYSEVTTEAIATTMKEATSAAAKETTQMDKITALAPGINENQLEKSFLLILYL